MQQEFRAISGQSIYDVCLNCYGTLDLLYRLLQDNGIDSVDLPVYSRQLFVYEDTLVVDQGINQIFTRSGKYFSTDAGKNGSVFFTSSGRPPLVKPPMPGNPNTTPKTPDMPTQVLGTSYTSNADGTTVITLTDVDGNSMIGNDLVQIELEIRPLTKSQWSWNKTSGQLTLLAGTTVDAGQTLFVIYSKFVTL